MKITTVARSLFATMLVVGLLFANSSGPRADNKDTPDDVMRVGRNANAGLSTMSIALRDTQAIASRLERDRAFATQVLDAAKKNDKRALADILKTVAPSSQITIQSISDFKFEAIIIVNGTQFYVCMGDGCKHHSGKTSPIVLEQD